MSAAFTVPHKLFKEQKIDRLDSKTAYIAFAAIVALCRTHKSNTIYASGRRLARMVGIDHTSMEDGIKQIENFGLIVRKGEKITFIAYDLAAPWSKSKENTHFHVPAIILDGAWYNRATMRVIRAVWTLLFRGLATEQFAKKDGVLGHAYLLRELDPVAKSRTEIVYDILLHPAFREVFHIEEVPESLYNKIKNSKFKVIIKIKNQYIVGKKDLVKHIFSVKHGEIAKVLKQLFKGYDFDTSLVNEIRNWAETYGINILREAFQRMNRGYFTLRLKNGEIENVSAYLHTCVRGFATDCKVVF